MKSFMLILEESPSDFAAMSPDEMQRIIERYSAWGRSLAERGLLVDGMKLTDDGGRVMRREGDAVRVVDGPYAEAKEVIGGVFVVRAQDYDAAVALAESCPHLEFGQIRVRQVDDVGADDG